MIRLVFISLASIFLLTGCYNKQSKTEILTEYSTKLVVPESNHYEYFKTPVLDTNITSKNKDEVNDALMEYSVKLQTVIMRYEERTDSLLKWKNEMVKIHGEPK